MDLIWVGSQTNRPLQSEYDVSRAYVEMVPYALPTHNERWKNWDAALALYHACQTTHPADPVLDAGACRDPKYPSPFLPGLQSMGYQRLYGCNLDETKTEYERGICYQHGDITELEHPDAYFGYVACLSVLEHGVDWRLFFTEMARVIKPGGHLFVSFDYWETPVDTGDRTAFGVPVKIFDRFDVTSMITYAGDLGFNLTLPADLKCRDKVVKWMGMEYTFYNLLFKRS